MTDLPTFTLGAVQEYHREGRSLILECGGPRVAVTILSPQMIRVRLAPDGALLPRRSWAVTRPDEEFAETPFELHVTDPGIVLRTDKLGISIARDPCRIAFVDPAGTVFCADSASMRWGRIPEIDAFSAPGKVSVACAKRVEAGEQFYGFGERTGLLNKMGRRMGNWTTDPPSGHGPGTDPLYMAIPVFMVVRPGLAYGIFFNNTWYSRFDIGREQTHTWKVEAAGGELDYYVMYGPTPAQVMAQMGELLGRMPLPPRWAIGYHQSRWSYASEGDIRTLAAEFRQRDIPCDVIHLDIDYMDGYRVFTWNAERVPDPTRLLTDLRRDHFRAVAIVDPGVKIDPAYAVYQQGLEQQMFIRKANGDVFQGNVWPGAAVFPDFTRTEVRAWWGELQKRLMDQGINGIWNDMNEPTSFERPFSEGFSRPGTIDLDAIQGPVDEQTTHAEVHNLYGSTMAQAAYAGLRRYRPEERPFVLTRSAYAGVQRWSAGWMGDNCSWWEHLEMTMPQLMNMGMSGVPFVGVDIGGFFGHATGELFVRWMQLGALLPFCRGHTEMRTERHEPWAFGPQVEAICREYLKLRYRLLPYFYTLFWEAAQQGAPLLRPLFYHFPDDQKTYHLHDQVMLGPWLLAAPIYHPGRESRAVYLPAGEWYDWWTEERISGPTHILAHAPLERMPLYVRAGAILPSGPEMNYTDEKPLDPLTLDLYPGDGTFTLYEDDGHSFAYEQGQFCTTRFHMRRDTGKHDADTALGGHAPRLIFECEARTGAYVPPARQVLLRVHAIDAQAAATIPEAQYDADRRILTLQLADNGDALHLEFGLD